MNNDRLNFIKTHIDSTIVGGKRVLEVGSRNVNGSIKPYLMSLKPKEYIGIDIREGENVDYVMSVNDLPYKFKDKFDIIFCIDTLEHIEDWLLAISSMLSVLKVNGYIVITVPSIGFKYHAHPNDYWRFTCEDFEYIFQSWKRKNIIKDNLATYFVGIFNEEAIRVPKIYSILKGYKTYSHTKFEKKVLSFYRSLIKQPLKTILNKVNDK